MCALVLWDSQSDRPEYPSYLTSFIEGVVAAREEMTHDVEAIEPTATDYLPQLGPYTACDHNAAADFEAMAAASAEKVTAAIGQ